MAEEQRRLFRETQAVMSLLEGFSDYVMDEVGRDLVPDVERISARFHERRERRRSPFERAILRLTGHGPQARAVPEGRAVRPADRRGRRAGRAPPAVGRPRDRCPGHGEIEDPRRWVARVMPRGGTDGADQPVRQAAYARARAADPAESRRPSR